MDAVIAGIAAKLTKVFDIDPLEMAADTFGEPFTTWNTKLTQFKDGADSYVETLVSQHEKELAWIKDVMDAASKISKILEVASIWISSQLRKSASDVGRAMGSN